MLLIRVNFILLLATSILILQMRKLRHRVVGGLVQGHTANGWGPSESRSSAPASVILGVCLPRHVPLFVCPSSCLLSSGEDDEARGRENSTVLWAVEAIDLLASILGSFIDLQLYWDALPAAISPLPIGSRASAKAPSSTGPFQIN